MLTFIQTWPLLKMKRKKILLLIILSALCMSYSLRYFSQVAWSVNYVFKHNGKLIDASVQPQLQTADLQRAITFTSPRKTSYSVYATSYNGKFEGFRKFEDQFSISFVGLVPTYITSTLEPVLKSTWETQMKSKLKRFF